MSARLEVHTHAIIDGPRASRGEHIEHSHIDGDTGHKHADTGPASFTIDRDAWAAATGMVGGGKKSYTRDPFGPQLERLDLEPWQKQFRVIFHESARVIPSAPVQAGHPVTGGAVELRMALQFDMEPIREGGAS